MLLLNLLRYRTDSSENKTVKNIVITTVETNKTFSIDAQEAATPTAATTTTLCSMTKSFETSFPPAKPTECDVKSRKWSDSIDFFITTVHSSDKSNAEKDDSSANASDRTRKESDPWIWV